MNPDTAPSRARRVKSRRYQVKIYRVNMYSSGEGRLLSWHANKREAAAALREFLNTRSDAIPEQSNAEPVEIGKTKAGFLSWLNSNFTSDNG